MIFNKHCNKRKRDSIKIEVFVKTSDAIALYMPPNLEFSYKADYRASETGGSQFAKQFVEGSVKDTLTNLGNGGVKFLTDADKRETIKRCTSQIGEFLGGGYYWCGKTIIAESIEPTLRNDL